VADNLAVAVDEELLEVPGHLAALKALGSEPAVEWVLPLAVSLDNLHHREVNLVLAGDFVDDLLRLGFAGAAPGLLRAELVARVSQDLQTVVLVIFVHLD